MQKNLKISEELHRDISIKAAKMGVGKSEMAEALLRCGISFIEDKFEFWLDREVDFLRPHGLEKDD